MRAKPKGWNPKGRVEQARMVATRRAIQGEYIRLLAQANFDFEMNDDEPVGLQKKVLEEVEKQGYGPTRLTTTK